MRRSGMSLVELLIALALVGVVFSVVLTYLNFQRRTSADVQGRNELNLRLRTVAEAIAQDLQLAGTSAVVTDQGGGAANYISGVRDLCLEDFSRCIVREPAPGADPTQEVALGQLDIVYASSLRPRAPDRSYQCRQVSYYFDADTGRVHRADQACPVAGTPTWTFANEFASGITSINVMFTCNEKPDAAATHDDVTHASLCFAPEGNFVRNGRIIVTGESDSRSGAIGTVELSANTPNVRTPVAY